MKRLGINPSGHKVIGRGTDLYRSTVGSQDYNTKHAYLSYNDVDRNHYKEGTWLKNTANAGEDAKIYEHQYRTNKDIVIADREDVRKAYDAYKNNKEVQKAMKDLIISKDESIKEYRDQLKRELELAKHFIEHNGASKTKYSEVVRQLNDSYGKAIKERTHNIIEQYKNLSSDDLFDVYARTLGGNPKMMKRTVDFLERQGFGAMYDQGSIGSNRRAEGVSAMIVFDKKNNLEKVGAREISRREQEKAGKKYAKWQRNAQRKKEKSYYKERG
jgi:hypothetical protein